jgi:hypothetical protein
VCGFSWCAAKKTPDALGELVDLGGGWHGHAKEVAGETFRRTTPSLRHCDAGTVHSTGSYAPRSQWSDWIARA